MKILITDDDVVSTRLVLAALQRDGHETIIVPDGYAAWHELTRSQFEVALLDWMMPGLDGVSLCQRLRQKPASPPRTHLIILTSRGRRQDIVTALEAGADEYLIKPFHPAELRARIRVAERIISLERRLTQQNRQLHSLASTDELTGLPNRRAIMTRLERELSLHKEDGAPFSVVMLDIDGFKQINDQHGHGVGDQVLQELTRRLLHSLRVIDTVGRVGGDEFLVLLPLVTIRDAVAVAGRICRTVGGEPFTLEASLRLAVTVSLGAAETAEGRASCNLLALADKALYAAKAAGGNTVCAVPESLPLLVSTGGAEGSPDSLCTDRS